MVTLLVLLGLSGDLTLNRGTVPKCHASQYQTDLKDVVRDIVYLKAAGPAGRLPALSLGAEALGQGPKSKLAKHPKLS